MCFHWQPLERQVRIEGRVEPVTAPEADAYFSSRERRSQIGAWASEQSRPIQHPEIWKRAWRNSSAASRGGTCRGPPNWSGFRLVPASIEFWRAMPGRLHERHLYTRDGAAWRIENALP